MTSQANIDQALQIFADALGGEWSLRTSDGHVTFRYDDTLEAVLYMYARVELPADITPEGITKMLVPELQAVRNDLAAYMEREAKRLRGVDV